MARSVSNTGPDSIDSRSPAGGACDPKAWCAIGVNTTAYHPQTDGLVERFNRTLTDMLAKTVDKSGRDWDARLPFVLFVYRTSSQESTRESPFFLMYGRDPQLPTEAALTVPPVRELVDVDSYKTDLVCNLADAWKLARDNVTKAQRKQKTTHDQSATKLKFSVGDRVFLFKPALKSGKAYKFAKPFQGPYRILKMFENGAEIQLVDKPRAESIRVALNRLRACPTELCAPSGDDEEERGAPQEKPAVELSGEQPPVAVSGGLSDGVWKGRLRSR